jgi:hypothetical protein
MSSASLSRSLRIGSSRSPGDQGLGNGVSVKTALEELAPYMRGWRGYFGFCETHEVLTV